MTTCRTLALALMLGAGAIAPFDSGLMPLAHRNRWLIEDEAVSDAGGKLPEAKAGASSSSPRRLRRGLSHTPVTSRSESFGGYSATALR